MANAGPPHLAHNGGVPECDICLESMWNDTRVEALVPCGHIYHTTCLDQMPNHPMRRVCATCRCGVAYSVVIYLQNERPPILYEDLEKTIKEQKQEMECKEQAIKEKEQAIHQKEVVMKQKEQAIKQKEEALKQKDQEIQRPVDLGAQMINLRTPEKRKAEFLDNDDDDVIYVGTRPRRHVIYSGGRSNARPSHS